MLPGATLLLGIGASAQESHSEISLEDTGFLTKDTTGLGTTERSTNTGGVLLGYRYKLNRWIAAEAVYGYDRNSQHYFSTGGFSRILGKCPSGNGRLRLSCADIPEAKNRPLPARRSWSA